VLPIGIIGISYLTVNGKYALIGVTYHGRQGGRSGAGVLARGEEIPLEAVAVRREGLVIKSGYGGESRCTNSIDRKQESSDGT
ncbi:MAG: hypothetical protein AAB538_00190, partial [Patescibacteria group bacterium]